MTDEELDKAADMIRRVGPAAEPVTPWEELSEADKAAWRALVQGDAGAAVD